MSTHALYTSLLRPPVLHILRAAGFQATRPSVLDTVVDLAARYFAILAQNVHNHAILSHNDLDITITDVRMALQDVGALKPQLSEMEEQVIGKEDTRGLEGFLLWMTGPENREIRRIAGMAGTEGEVVNVGGLEGKEDFLTALKKKHSKTGEESRFQGTVLGKEAEDRPIKIEGGPWDTIQAWSAHLQQGNHIAASAQQDDSPKTIDADSSPLSDV